MYPNTSHRTNCQPISDPFPTPFPKVVKVATSPNSSVRARIYQFPFQNRIAINTESNNQRLTLLIKMLGNSFKRMFPHIQHLIIICLLCAVSYVEARNTPETAHNNKFRGSTCERGFRKSHGKCLRVKVPHNGKLNALANNWVCKRGFYKVGQRCLQVKIPNNGKLNYRGDDWTCKSGFFRAGDQCVQLKLNGVGQNNHIYVVGRLYIGFYVEFFPSTIHSS